jgi:fructose/tagatose bisphosphate aldolase
VRATIALTVGLGLANLRDIVDNLIDELGIELYLNLDHAPTVDAAVAAIDAGFELVHIDVSQDAAETSRWVRDSPVAAPAHARAGRRGARGS